MEKVLIIPAAGKSSRFKKMRPKWLLTMPDGKLMIEKSLGLLNRQEFDRVIVTCLKEHLDAYIKPESLIEILSKLDFKKINICILDGETKSQSETVAATIIKEGICGPIFVKDCDNEFSFSWDGGNEIATVDLHTMDKIDACNKSYVELDSLGKVQNIVEKKVISSYFCCGGYGFANSDNFLQAFDSIKTLGEIYLSHVIFEMIMRGVNFQSKLASNYQDWGTARDYLDYQQSHLTLFCDVDGVLFKNGSKFGAVGWKTPVIKENLTAIKELKDSGLLFLVITSSRPESEIPHIEKSLAIEGITADRYLMDLPHAKRVLVNDYSLTNPYPSAQAINISRDSPELSNILKSFIS